MTEFNTLRAANAARQAEWDTTGGGISLAFRGNEMAGEVGEACNVIKKLERERLGIRGSRATVVQLGEELADVVICADLTALDAGIDLDAAIAAKFNATSEKVGLATRLQPSRAVADVLAERRRHVEVEGWSPENDDEHRKGELAAAAANYALAARIAAALDAKGYTTTPPLEGMGWAIAWPWAPHWWKPGPVRRMLVKAASLIIAEIERLDRAEAARGR